MLKTTNDQKKINTIWKKEPYKIGRDKKVFSSDEMIDAYFKGKSDALKETEQMLQNNFIENLASAKKLCENIYIHLKENNINCKKVLLRPFSITTFDSLFIVPKKDYISSDFIAFYKYAQTIKNEHNKELFYFDVAFMPYSNKIDNVRISSDGYTLSYG